MGDLEQALAEQALATHGVLFFRDQDLTAPEQRDFAAQFGPLEGHPAYASVAEAPEVLIPESTAAAFAALSDAVAANPPVEHPVVIRHPVTERCTSTPCSRSSSRG